MNLRLEYQPLDESVKHFVASCHRNLGLLLHGITVKVFRLYVHSLMY